MRSWLNNSLATQNVVDSVTVCNTISDLSTGAVSDVEGLTKFANEACSDVEIRDAMYTMPRGVPSPIHTELKEYLARPIVYTRGVYNNTTPGNIFTLTVETSTFPVFFPHLDRIRGSFGFRATLVFRVEVQATPYHAGRLRMCWEPEVILNPAAPTTYDRAYYLTTASQLPGVEMNINESTSMVMRVPFVNSNDYWWYNSNNTSYAGLVSLFALHPVSTPAGASNPNYSVWTSLEDVELIAAAAPSADLNFVTPVVGSTSILPMASSVYNDAVSASRAARLVESTAPPQRQSSSGLPLVPTPPPITRDSLVPQAGDPNSSETKSPLTPVASMLSAASRVATYMNNIPVISSYAGPTSWALRVGARLASAFGWSKPQVTSAVTRVLQTQNNYQYNCDGHDASWNMGLFSDNHVAPLPGFAGSDVDEMSMSYIASVPAIVSTFTFRATNAASDVLYLSALSPYAAWYAPGANILPVFTPVASPVSSFLPSPLFYLANCFRYWRGDLTFRFKVSKTMFHSGRLLISSHYNYAVGNTTLPTPNYSKPFNFNSVLWDLKDSSEIEFTVPYTHLRAFAYFSEVLGSLCVSVEQPLLAPSSVASSVFISVEVYSKNMTFAFPTTPLFQPAPFRPYMVTPQAASTQHVQGEDVLSVKQLAARQGYDAVYTTSGYIDSTVLNIASATYTPNPTSPTGVNYPTGTMCDYVLRAYAYARGSTRIALEPAQGNSHLTVTLAEANTTDCSGKAMVSEKGQCLRATVPYYAQATRWRVSSNAPGTNTALCMRTVPSGANYYTVSYLSAADDFQCGYFLGAPPLDRVYTASNNLNTALVQAINATYVS